MQARALLARGPARVLVIGASTGLGWQRASRPRSARARPRWRVPRTRRHCRAAGHGRLVQQRGLGQAAHADGRYTRSINGDAFSDAVKQRTIATLRADLGQVVLVLYSLASPRRTHPVSGRVFTCTLKPIGQPLQARTIDTDRQVLRDTVLEPATPEEIEGTIAVMGGEIMRAIYWDGSIGAAKKDLDLRVQGTRGNLSASGGDARVSVLKALVTQASAAIPMMPPYLSLPGVVQVA